MCPRPPSEPDRSRDAPDRDHRRLEHALLLLKAFMQIIGRQRLSQHPLFDGYLNPHDLDGPAFLNIVTRVLDIFEEYSNEGR